FPYMTGRLVDLDGVTAWAQRVTYVGELGWEIYVPRAEAGRAWDVLWLAGRERGIRAVGYKALESLRLGKGYRYWSADITPSENPYGAGLGFCVRLQKGDFIGREALVRIKAAGVSRRLSSVTVAPEALLYGGEVVYAGGRVVGRLRSAGWGYTGEASIGLGYPPRELARPGAPPAGQAVGARFPARAPA